MTIELVPAVALKVSSPIDEVWRLTNVERHRHGARPLGISTRLQNSAGWYAKLMHDRDWFDHTRPDGTSWFDSISHRFHWPANAVGGENIAKGQHSAAEVVKAWMDSPGHRRNILDPHFRWIGCGQVGNFWVQDFGYPIR